MNAPTRTALVTLPLALMACAPTRTTPPSTRVLNLTTTSRVGLSFPATSLQVNYGRDGGLLLSGRLDGRFFTANFPPDWNGRSVLYPHGYELPSDQPDAAATDLVNNDDMGGILPVAHGSGQ